MLSDTTYDLDTLVLLFNLRWAFLERGEIWLDLSWARSDAMFDTLEMVAADDVPTVLFPDGLPGPGLDPTAPVAFSDFDFSEVNEYSHLEYTEMRSTLGIRYQVYRRLSLYGAVSYYDLDDDNPYLQDATGDVTVVTTGLSWSSS